jgi:hypothetical protein
VDGDANDLGLLVACAEHESSTLRSDPRLATPLPGKRGAALRDHLLDLLNAVDQRLTQQPDASAPQSVQSAFARNLRQSIFVLRGAHAALPWLAATRLPALNLGSLYLAEENALALVGRDVDLVVVPNPDYMYSTTSWPFREVILATPEYSPITTRRPIVLNYPLTDSDRLLVHPIFAHELGHASVQEHELVNDVESALVADAGFSAAFAAANTGGLPLRGVLRRWIEELLCDHLAVEAMGPAFLWSFAPFVLPFSYAEAGPSHPPNPLRIRLLIEYLVEKGWRPFMDIVAPNVMSWLDSVTADATKPLPGPFDFLRDSLLIHAGLIRDAASNRVGTNRLDRDRAEGESEEAALLLQRLILPVGLTRILQPRAILLGGWREVIREHGDSPQGIVKGLADNRLQDLVGKAIEMSVVSTAWSA